jgi:hypothetical protein
VLPIPKGYVHLIEAFNAVGRDSYGEDWIGDQANQLAKFASPIRYRGSRSDSEKGVIADADKANEQRWAVFNALQRDFLGTPPAFGDAVFVYLLADNGEPPRALPPKIWIDDNEARRMLTMGRANSGILLVAETSLPGRASAAISQPETVCRDAPPETAQGPVTDPPAAASAGVATPTPRGRRGSDDDIRTAVEEYKQAEAAAGRQPNMDRAVDYVLAEFQRAGRTRVRGFYTIAVGQKTRGRPRKSRP